MLGRSTRVMTTRDRLIRHQSQSLLVTIPCGIAFIAGMTWGGDRNIGFALVAIGVLGFIAYGLLVGVRCVHCRHRVDQTLHMRRRSWTLDRDIRFCPYCARSLDEPAHDNAG